MHSKHNNKYALLLAGLAVVMLLYQNHVRNLRCYAWGFTGKLYSINLVPLRVNRCTIGYTAPFLLRQFAYFVLLGMVICLCLHLLKLHKTWHFMLAAAAAVTAVQLLSAASARFSVFVDINSWLLQLGGLAAGRALFSLVLNRMQKAAPHSTQNTPSH